MKKEKTPAEQAEVLNTLVNLDGRGEDPAVKAAMSPEFISMKDSDALQIGNMLREIITGQQYSTEQLNRMSARMDAFEDASKKFNEDQEKYIQGVFDRAEKLKATGDAKDRLIAKGANQLEEAIKQANASKAVAKLKFDDVLSREQKVTITSPGVPETIVQDGVPTAVLSPDVIRIKHRTWVIMPNIPTEVPKLVADRYEIMLRGREETRERQSALQANLKDTDLAIKLNEINKKYGSPTDPFRVGSTA